LTATDLTDCLKEAPKQWRSDVGAGVRAAPGGTC